MQTTFVGTLFLGLGVGALLTACGSSKPDSSFTPPDAGGSPGGDGAIDDTGGTLDTGPGFGGDSSTQPVDSGPKGPPPGVPFVYAHSPTQLYRLNPSTKAVSVIGTFSGACALDTIIDIALDASSDAYVTGFGGFYKLDLMTAACTLIAPGSYPNSLSFVPKGTLDPNKEALVGYQGSTYVRIDTTTGAISNVGNLSGGYQSSGDIVSVIGGGTFLTVNGNGCADCLLQVNPKTGDLVQNYGSVMHPSVFGLAFWAGTVYGFDDGGQIFSIDSASGTLVIHDIPVPNPPAGLEFYGAGSTTSAPAAAPDGGGIPIQ